MKTKKTPNLDSSCIKSYGIRAYMYISISNFVISSTLACILYLMKKVIGFEYSSENL